MKKNTLSSLLLVSCSLLTGCSTIMHGTCQNVAISSNPPSARVWVDKLLVGRTPLNVKLERNKNHTVSIELEGYRPYEVYLEKNISAWILGNIVFGGFIGIGIDAISGGIYKLTPRQIEAELCKEDIVYSGYQADTYFAVLNNVNPKWEKIGQLEKN